MARKLSQFSEFRESDKSLEHELGSILGKNGPSIRLTQLHFGVGTPPTPPPNSVWEILEPSLKWGKTPSILKLHLGVVPPREWRARFGLPVLQPGVCSFS